MFFSAQNPKGSFPDPEMDQYIASLPNGTPMTAEGMVKHSLFIMAASHPHAVLDAGLYRGPYSDDINGKRSHATGPHPQPSPPPPRPLINAHCQVKLKKSKGEPNALASFSQAFSERVSSLPTVHTGDVEGAHRRGELRVKCKSHTVYSVLLTPGTMLQLGRGGCLSRNMRPSVARPVASSPARAI
jgi:hypothetical protein